MFVYTTCLPKPTVPHFCSHCIVARHTSFRCWRICEVSFNFLLSKNSFLVICFCFRFPQYSIFFTQPIQIISVLFMFFESSRMFVTNSFFTGGQGMGSFFVDSSFLDVGIVPTFGWICQCRRRGWWGLDVVGRNCRCGYFSGCMIDFVRLRLVTASSDWWQRRNAKCFVAVPHVCLLVLKNVDRWYMQ